jgi:hypothetical protein
MIVTISCPTTMSHPEINPDTAPVWADIHGMEYYVVSGILSEYEATEWTEADPAKITVIVGMDGLQALAEMGLTVVESNQV